MACIRPGLRESLRSHLIRLQKEVNQTSVYVTHDQEEALTIGEQIVIMREGRIEQVGSPEDVYLRPKTRFVASFLGMPPMNFLPASVEDGDLRGPWGSLTWKGANPPSDSVVAGIRPEHLSVTSPEDGELVGTVTSGHGIGRTRLLFVDLNGVQLRVKTGEVVASGNQIGLRPMPERLVLFDSESEEAI